MPALETVHLDGSLQIYSSRNLHVNIWNDAPTGDQMRAFNRFGAAHARRHPKGAALLNVITSGTPSFSQDVRDEAVKLMKNRDMFRLGAAHVVLLHGFAGTATRSFLSTAMLLGRPSFPSKVFSDAPSAAAWLTPLLAAGAESWTQQEIVQLVNQAARPQ